MKNSEIEATGALKDEVLSEERERVPREGEEYPLSPPWIEVMCEENSLIKAQREFYQRKTMGHLVLESAVVAAAIEAVASRDGVRILPTVKGFTPLCDAVDALIKAREESK